MADVVNSNIIINVDTSSAMAQLRALEKELTALNRSLVVGTKTAAQAQSKYTQGLLHNVNATGQWTSSIVKMNTASEQFANNLDKSRLSLKEYFRYGMASTKTFGKMFGGEFDTISKLVQKRVKTLQQQYTQLGRDASGAMNAIKFTPKNLNYKDMTTQLMMATQRQQIFNKLIDDGSTKLLNFGKNTQWAGRQLMVGFTIPLMLFGSQAIRIFKEIETQTIRFKKVYGEVFTDPGQTDLALKNIKALANEYTKYGIKVSETIGMAADAAAAGFSGNQLQEIVKQTNRLAVLGGVTQEKALETTIALRNAFQIGSEDLSETINFLNAVENQTVVALDDLTTAIPRVAPVVQQLGGDVRDLAFFMAAMQEGGISAAQGANALKSGLASLINPSTKASAMLAELGININGIIEENQGNLRNTVVGFAQALEPLTDLQRTRAIEQLFGKFQFARISALLNNVSKEGTQAARVLQLANASIEELGILAERELGVQSDSAMNKFAGAVERLKASIAPVGEVFAKALTPAIEFITKMSERFNKLPEGIKKGIAVVAAVVGGLGPIFLMTFGLMANAMANSMKGFNLLRKGYQQLSHGSTDAALRTQYLTQEELENISVSNALYSTHEKLSAAYKLESTALGALITQYGRATAAMRGFSMSNPGLFIPGRGVPPIRRAGGGTVSGPGTATSDSIPAYLSDGEYVINAKAVDTYGVDTFDALNARKYASGGPVIGKDGIPRLFSGGWMSRIIQSMLPKTRMGVVQDGFALSGFAGLGSKSSASRLVPSTSTAKKIPWQEDASDPKSLVILDPTTGQKFKISKTSKTGFDKLYDDLVQQGKIQKRGARPEMSPEEYLIHRLFKKYKQGKPLTPLNVLGQAGSAGKSRVRVTGISEAKSRWGKAVDTPKVRVLQKFFDKEKDHLRSVLPKEVFDTLEANNSFVVSPSHIVAAGKNRKVSDWTREKILRDTSLVNFGMNYLTRSGKRLPKNTPHPTTQAEADNVIKAIELLKTQGPLAPTLQGTLEALKYRTKQGFYNSYAIKDTDLGLKMGGMIQKYAGGAAFVGMPKSFAKVQKLRALGQQLDLGVKTSRFKNLPTTNTGVKLKSLGGYSVGEISRSVNGIYRHPNGRVVVYKAVESEDAALAEMRMSALMRSGSQLNTPKSQSIKVIADPTDLTRQRRILAIESDYDPRFENPKGEFTNKQFIKQTLASGIRGDKDVKRSNLSGDDVIDQGNSGVFSTASSRFKYADSMKSVEEQLLINFGAVKGGASKDFAKAVRKMAKQMGYPAFKRSMLKEIEESVPRYRATIDTFKLNPKERKIYDDLVLRLEESKNADWKKVYNAAAGIPGYENGVFSVPGPKGAGDVVPAMLSPGEAVIPTAESEKYRPLIRSIIADKVPGFITGRTGIDDPWDTPSNVPKSRGDILADKISGKVADATTRSGILGGIARRITSAVDRAANSGPTPMTSMERRAASAKPVPMPGFSDLKNSVDKNTKAVQSGIDASNKNTKGVLNRLKFDRKDASEQERIQKTRGLRGFVKGYATVPDFEKTVGKGGREKFLSASSGQKTNARQLDRMNRSQRMMGPSMGLAMGGSMAMMYGMSKPESFLGQNMGAIMGVTVLAGLLPMLNSPIKMLIAGALGLVAVFKLQSNQIKQSILDGREQGKTMISTKEELEAFGNLTGQVSKTQTAEAQRASRTTEIVPVSIEFGKNFIEDSDFGKTFQADFQKTIETFGRDVGGKTLANQLATAVGQGVLTAEQAQSIAIAITRDLKDSRLEMQVRGKLIELLGPNGENITKDPIELQLKLIYDQKQIQQETLKNLKNVISKERSGFAGLGGQEALALGISAIPAAGAGALATGAMYRGQVVGHNIRGAENLGLKGKKAKQFMSATEMARGTGKLGMAANAVRSLRVGSQVGGAAASATGVGVVPGAASAIVGTVVFGSIEAGLRAWQRGNEKKAIGKASGIFSGVTTELLKSTQQSIDAFTAQIGDQIKILEAKKKIAKTAQETSNIEKQIAILESQRTEGTQKVYEQQAEILNNLEASYNQIGKSTFFEKVSPFGTGRGQLRDKFMESFQEGTDAKFKKDPMSQMYIEQLRKDLQKITPTTKGDSRQIMADSERQKNQSDIITLKIEALINSDVLSAEQAVTMASFLSGDRIKAQQELEAIVTVHGNEGLQRMATLQEYIPKNKNKKILQLMVQTSNKQDADETMTALEEIVKLPRSLGYKVNMETDKDDMEDLEVIGQEIQDIRKAFPDGVVSLTLLQNLQTKSGGPGKNMGLDEAIKYWDAINNVPKNVQLAATITLTTITQTDSFDKIIEREMESAFKAANPQFAGLTQQMLGQLPDSFRRQYETGLSTFLNDATERSKVVAKYLATTLEDLYGKAVPSTIKTPGKGGGEEKGKGPDTTWLSDLLQRLKLLKEGSIDATGKFSELLAQVTKYFGPNALASVNPMLDKQVGALKQIEKAATDAGFALSTEMRAFVESLDAEAFEDFSNKFLTTTKNKKTGAVKITGFKQSGALSDAAYDRRQKDIESGKILPEQASLFGQINEAMKTNTIAEFIKKQQDSIDETNNQVTAFRTLTDSTGDFKLDALSAMEVLKDPTLANDIALGKKIFSKEERELIISGIEKTYAAASKLSQIKMIQGTEELNNQVIAFDKLAAAGYNYETILKVIENEAFAYQIAKDKVDGLSDATKSLVKDTENYVDALKSLENTKFFKERSNALQLQKDFSAIAPILVKMGLELEDLSAILSNPNLAKSFIEDLRTGKLDAEQLQKYINEIPEFKRFELEIKLSTREGKEEEFDKLFSKAMEYYDLLEGKIEDEFEPLLKNAQDTIRDTQEEIEGINDEIKDFQDTIDTKQRNIELKITRPIGILQKESSELDNDLDLINRSADEITKRYDEQAEALTKVSEINSRIANQQKQQLSLADALSQGDISAAAVAAQEIRASSAEAMQEDQLGILGAAKERDLANLRNKEGLTRLQIENRQFEISQLIYDLEQKREVELLAIRDIEDDIYEIKVGRLKTAQDELDLANKNLNQLQKQRDAAIEAVDKQREVWRDAQLAIGFARIDAGYYNDVIEFSNTLIDLMKGGWLGVGDAILAAVAALALYNTALNAPAGAIITPNSNIDSTTEENTKALDAATEANNAAAEAAVMAAEAAADAAWTEMELAENRYENASSNLDSLLSEYDSLAAERDLLLSQATTLAKLANSGNTKNAQKFAKGIIDVSGGGGATTQFMSMGGTINPLYRPMGGLIPYFLGGGFAKGTDTVPAMLTPGEFVMSRYAVNAHGVDRMKAINSGDSIGESVYNYSINVNVKSDANPDEIARAVMTQIKQVDSKRLRGAKI